MSGSSLHRIPQKIADAELDELVRIVRGKKVSRPDYNEKRARDWLRIILQVAQTLRPEPTARAQNRRRALEEVASQAHALKSAHYGLTKAYAALDSAALASLFAAIHDQRDIPPRLLLDDETYAGLEAARADATAPDPNPSDDPAVSLDATRSFDDDVELPYVHPPFFKSARPSLNWPEVVAESISDLQLLERAAAAAARPEDGKRGRQSSESAHSLVRLLAGFVDWCGRSEDDPRGGGQFPHTIRIRSGRSGAFYKFVLAATWHRNTAGTPLLRAVRDVVQQRDADASSSERALVLPDPSQSKF